MSDNPVPLFNVPPGYQLQADGKTLKKVIDSFHELRHIYGKNPITGEDQRKYHAFYVSLPIEETGFSKGPDRRDGVFTHAQNGTQAATQAALFWNDKMRRRLGLYKSDWPKVATTEGPTDLAAAPISIMIDDDDLDKFWKDAKKLPHICAGNPSAPVSFMVLGTDIFEIDQTKLKK